MVPTRFGDVVAICVLLCGALAATAAGPVLETAFDASEVAIEVDGTYAKLEIDGTAAVKTPGEPALPIRYLRFVIPSDSRVEDIVITGLVEQELPGTYRVMPAQQEVPTGETPIWSDPDPAIYESDAPYPASRVQFLGDGYLGGYRIASVAVYPLTYIPSTGKLTLATELAVELSLTAGTNRAQPRHRMTARSDRLYRTLVGNLVENPEATLGKLGAIEIVDGAGPEGFQPRYTPSLEGSPVEYVIITSDAYAPQFQEFADWKTQKGVPAVVKTISWINANYPGGCDTAERIRLFIKDAFTSWGTTYVLLGGDTNIVPVRYAWSGYYGGWKISTDLYYSDLDGNWNADGDSRFGEAYVSIAAPGDSIDLYSDVFVGRAPVATLIEVETFINKAFAYEKAPAPVCTDRDLIMAEVLFPYDWVPGEFISTDGAANIVEPMRSTIPPEIHVALLYQNYVAFPESYPLNDDAAIDSLTAGYNITAHVGHGNKDILRVSRDNYITIQDTDALANGIDRAGFVWMLNCYSTMIESDCIAEHLLNNPVGGFSSLFGPTRFCFPTTAKDYFASWFQAFYSLGLTQAGVVAAACKSPYVPGSFYDNTDRWTQLSFVFLGDPEVRLWTGRPAALAVAHPASIPLGPTDVTVTVTDPAAVQGALVCVAKEGEVYATGYTDAAGEVDLTFTPKTTGTLTITVTAENHFPHEGTIEITPSAGAHLSLRQMTADDDDAGWSDGNGNGLTEAGEAIELDIRVGNGGQAAASGVTATLTDGDAYLTLVDGTHILGTIPAGAEVDFEAAFLLAISDDCPNEYEAVLGLTLTDAARGTWYDSYTLRIYRPKLIQASTHVDDEAGGDGNGIPNIGETIVLTIDVQNEGNGLADQVTGTLSYPNSDVTINDGTDTWGDLEAGETVTGQSGFEFTVNATMTQHFLLTLTDEDGKEWAYYFDMLRPLPLGGLEGSVKATTIFLTWGPGSESDLRGYNVYRTDDPDGTYSIANDGLIRGSSYFEDSNLNENQKYYYRVTAADSSGNESLESAMLEISTNPPSQPGWPLQAGEAMYGSTAAVDIDLDGDLEILVGAGDVYCWHHDGVEYTDGDGDPRTNGVFTTDGEAGYRSSLAFGEMDHDPYPEFVGASWGNFGTAGNPEYRIFAWNAEDGSLLPGWPRSTSQFCWATPALGDVTGDGLADVVIISGLGNLCCWDSYGVELIDGDNNPATDGVFAYLDANWTFGSPVLVDIDNDRSLEILAPSRSESIYIFEADGSRVPGWPVMAGGGDPGGLVASPCAADLNGDGQIEIVVQANDSHMICLDASGNTLPGWPVGINVGGDFPASPTLADLDGDGDLEIVQVDEDGYIHILPWEGEEFDPAGWPQLTADGLGLPQSSPAVGDVDGDGLPDIIVGDNANTMHAFHANGETVAGWPIAADAEIVGSPTLADLDGDGDTEVVVGGQDLMVYIWDTPGEHQEGDAIQWGTWRHDVSRTGYFEYELPVGVADSGPAAGRTLRLEQNVPNPFNPVTTISYTIGAGVSEAELGVYNVAGRLVRTLDSGVSKQGKHTAVWDGRDDGGERVASGIYFVTLTAGNERQTRKVVLLK
jgi:hypothetical protein